MPGDKHFNYNLGEKYTKEMHLLVAKYQSPGLLILREERREGPRRWENLQTIDEMTNNYTLLVDRIYKHQRQRSNFIERVGNNGILSEILMSYLKHIIDKNK